MTTSTDRAPGSSDVPDQLGFECPRCGTSTTAAYYGPCGPCRVELRAAFVREARELETVAYEPKMNVVPNQIASKD